MTLHLCCECCQSVLTFKFSLLKLPLEHERAHLVFLIQGYVCVFRKELTAEARELKGELYCLPCHDKMGIPICGACRRPIEGRVVNALGKQWHVEVRLL